MYSVSVRNLDKEVVLERTMAEQPTQRDFDALLNEVDEDCFIDVCRIDPDFGDHLLIDQALDFECIPAFISLERFDGE